MDIFEKKKSCVIPFTDGQHWRVFLIDARQNTVYHFDSLGGSIPDSLKQPMTEIFTSVWKIRDIKKIYQADCYQCGVWVYLAVRGFLEFLEQEQTEEFKLESFEEIVILENTSDKRNDHFISLTREQMREELEFACSKDELSFKSPPI